MPFGLLVTVLNFAMHCLHFVTKLIYNSFKSENFDRNHSFSQIMQMYSMHRRLGNSKVCVTSLHPEVVDTGLMRESQDSWFRQLAMGAVRSLGKLLQIHNGTPYMYIYSKNGVSGIVTKLKEGELFKDNFGMIFNLSAIHLCW